MGAEIKRHINIPRIASIETAIRIHDENLYLGTKEIKTLFPGIGNARVSTLKKAANECTREHGRIPYSAYDVLAEDAYIAWHRDIKELKKKHDEILRLEKKIAAVRGAV